MINKDLARAVSSAIHKECANYYEGMCIPLDCKCVQMDSPYSLQEGKVLCKWCALAILPTHPELQRAIALCNHDTQKKKKCAICASRFFPTCNRQKLCAGCRALQAKYNARDRKRKSRMK